MTSGGQQDLGVILGKPVEITHDEARALKVWGDQMHRAAFHQRQGWFLEYLTAHQEAHKVIRTVFARSHEAQ